MSREFKNKYQIKSRKYDLKFDILHKKSLLKIPSIVFLLKKQAMLLLAFSWCAGWIRGCFFALIFLAGLIAWVSMPIFGAFWYIKKFFEKSLKNYKKTIDKMIFFWYTINRQRRRADDKQNQINIAASPSGKATDSDSVIT